MKAPNTSFDEDFLNKSELHWKDIDPVKALTHVRRLQIRIIKAEKEGKRDLVKRLQHLLTNSFYAKYQAVKRVSSNPGSKTPGIDGIIWETDQQKMEAVKALSNKAYHAKPLKRIYIPKKNGKLRPLAIPTMYDRAMQALHSLALDPVAECRLYRHQYGFRLGRCCQDAAQQIFTMLAPRYRPRFILEGDIKSCFSEISHDWLMENIPMNKRVMKEFLDAGYIYHEKLYPTELGTPQGSIISPVMANLVLAELGLTVERIANKRRKIHAVIYADDFIVTSPDRATAEEIMRGIAPILGERGLMLSAEKTLITPIEEGFNFLSFNFKEYSDGKVRVTPSKEAVKQLKSKFSELFRKHTALTQDDLILQLNKIITGWGNYHRHNVSSKVFRNLDHFLFDQCVRWARRRHPTKSWNWIKRKYWHRKGTDNWCFCTEKRFMKRFSNIGIKRYTKIKCDKNPYIDTEYFLKRRKEGPSIFRRQGKIYHNPKIS